MLNIKTISLICYFLFLMITCLFLFPVFNVGSVNCSRYGDSVCKHVAECLDNKCQCPYETYRQTGEDGVENTTCDKSK